jgi:hypothetical protein
VIGVVFCGIGVLLWLSGVLPLWHGLRRFRTLEGSRFLGFLVFGAGVAALVLAMAWGRAGWVPLYGMPDRYVALSVPGLCAAYFAWLLYGPPAARDGAANAFALAALLALPFNIKHGLAVRDTYEAGMQAFEQDAAGGSSWRQLADNHCNSCCPFRVVTTC